MSHRIPFAALKPHLEKYLRERLPGIEEEVDPYGVEMQNLAWRIGVHPDTISKPYAGADGRATVSFATADALICAMDIPMIWHDDPVLRELYWPGERPPDPMKPVKCRNPKCDEWLPLIEIPTTGAIEGATRYRKTIYCDDNCKAQAHHAKNPRRRSRAVRKSRYRSPESREAYNAYMRRYRALQAQRRAVPA